MMPSYRCPGALIGNLSPIPQNCNVDYSSAIIKVTVPRFQVCPNIQPIHYIQIGKKQGFAQFCFKIRFPSSQSNGWIPWRRRQRQRTIAHYDSVLILLTSHPLWSRIRQATYTVEGGLIECRLFLYLFLAGSISRRLPGCTPKVPLPTVIAEQSQFLPILRLTLQKIKNLIMSLLACREPASAFHHNKVNNNRETQKISE